MVCKNCEKEISDSAKFCPYCGKNVQNVPESNGQKLIQSIEKPPDKKATFRFNAILIIVSVAVCILGVVIITAIDNKSHKETGQRLDAIQNAHFEFLPDITIGELLNNTHSWLEPNNDGKDSEMWKTMNDYPTFWGVNDETGITLEITFAGYNVESGSPKISKVRKDTYDNPLLQDISDEEFEAYILDLYSYYNGNNKSSNTMVSETDVKTLKTTDMKTNEAEVKTTASEPAKTTIEAKKDEPHKSSDYLIYLTLINAFNTSIQKEYNSISIPYHYYCLYDIDNNGVYELLFHIGESEADAEILIYSVDENGELVEIGEIAGGHTRLIEKDGKLYSYYGHNGYQVIEEIQISGQSVKQKTVLEQDNSYEYIDYGTAVTSYDISDTSAVEALCPQDAFADRPYVNAYVETYAFSGREGFESWLYLDGDFVYVSVESQYNDYDDYDTYNEYTYDEVSDGIIVYQGSSTVVPTLYIIPYNKSGVAGDMVICDIPTNASKTIQTGAFSYALNSEMKGQINCHGETVAGFTTDYIVNGGAAGKVRNSLGDKWHITAKNVCDNYGVTWYELWDSDDGDYYGWVDSSYIDFY